MLPELEDFRPDGSGRSPLARVPDFRKTTCPSCGGAAQREADVSDNFLDSAWYFLRYPSSGCDQAPFEPEITRKWLPVDMYIGGNEHAVLHLLYTRFLTMALHDMGLIGFEEPFRRFRCHGLITWEGAKMSKSRGNVVNPDDYMREWGVDAFRMYLMFMAPFEQGGDFRTDALRGTRRFLERVWRFVHEAERSAVAPSAETDGVLRAGVAEVTDAIRALRYNRAVGHVMGLFNRVREHDAVHPVTLRVLLQILSPFCPHIAQELWQACGNSGHVHDVRWPFADAARPPEPPVEVPVKIDRQVVTRVRLRPGATESDAVALARASDDVRRRLASRRVVRTVFVPGRILAFVTEAGE
jgi:leucyl-tRNA synthetase